EEARQLVARVADPAARALFEAQLARDLASTGFSFPVILDQRAVRVAARWSPSEAWFTARPALRTARAREASERARALATGREVALSARDAFYAVASARASEALAALS